MSRRQRSGRARRQRGRARHLHVSRAAQQRYALPAARFGLYGRLLELDLSAAADWSRRVAEGRRAGAREGDGRPFSPGELIAAVALHELMHALIGAATGGGAPYAGALGRAHAGLEAEAGAARAAELIEAFGALFAPAAAGVAADGAASAATSSAPTEPPLTGSAPTDAPRVDPTLAETALEELLLLELARRNPALAPFRELFEEGELVESPPYGVALGVLERELGRTGARAGAVPGRPAPGPGVAGGNGQQSLYELLLAPQRRAPGSLLEQLRLAVSLWRPYLNAYLDDYSGAGLEPVLLRALRAADVLAEEAKRAPAAPGPPAPPPLPVIDESEPEAFTPDAAWMPGVVLVAKSTFVWLAQLSERYGRPVTTLDDIPGEALVGLAEEGFNTLWLLGVWWRSPASRTIKQLRGQEDAIASAYSVYDYQVAPDLGGEEALARLRARAETHGLRLASDMVANHTALDARWVAEHPDWFVQTPALPYPGYRFTGPDLSSDPRMSLRIEDGYYDGSDAAVVFQREDRASGEARFIYHGNDGTALPWNDTAQLDYLREDVRRAVIDTTVAVARRFPVIRLDAAMTLARRHVRRLWHPEPGRGGAVPSRAGLALPQAEFDRLMPREFWRELVERLAAEAPDTMLLAEAFWLMEVYFVRSLGMNRVYNSAFMHMTMNEENAAHRRYLKRYLEQEPRILARFVNYMSNPDEESAAEQFGDGDKAFGVTTLLATLPGLPLFGHGQVEGLREKYGMEFARPRLAEAPRAWHRERHLEQIAPLLARRVLFAGSERFRLFDLEQGGAVAEDVFAFVNGAGSERALVAYNNGPRAVTGRLHLSAPVKVAGEVRRERLVDALGLPAGAERAVAVFPAFPGGPELRMDAQELADGGLTITLAPYEARVFLGVRVEAAGEGGVGGGAASAAGALRSAGRRPRPAPQLQGRRGEAARRRARRRRR